MVIEDIFSVYKSVTNWMGILAIGGETTLREALDSELKQNIS